MYKNEIIGEEALTANDCGFGRLKFDWRKHARDHPRSIGSCAISACGNINKTAITAIATSLMTS